MIWAQTEARITLILTTSHTICICHLNQLCLETLSSCSIQSLLLLMKEKRRGGRSLHLGVPWEEEGK